MSRPVLLIAGGSRGIGAATAKLAGAAGYDVAVNYNSNANAAAGVVEAVKSVRRQGGRAARRHGRRKPTSSACSRKPPRSSGRSRISCIRPASSANSRGSTKPKPRPSARCSTSIRSARLLCLRACVRGDVDQAWRQRRRGRDGVVDGGDAGRRQRMRLVCRGQRRRRFHGDRRRARSRQGRHARQRASAPA